MEEERLNDLDLHHLRLKADSESQANFMSGEDNTPTF